MPDTPSYDDFKTEWLQDVRAANPSTVELGNRFAQKLVTQWRDVDLDSTDIHFCDGSGDGGVDVAFLQRGESRSESDSVEGDTWYLVQSKYGSAFQGTSTLLLEGQKVIDTLDGQPRRLSSIAAGLQERIKHFRESASQMDKIVLVYATVDPLNQDERRSQEDVREMGRRRLGPLFDVEAISVETIYQRTLQELGDNHAVRVPLRAQLSSSSAELLIGAVTVTDLYAFLKAYRGTTQDLDRIYEKNIRRFLGGRGRVNRRIQQTLQDEPERFGLYNNGITVVVTDFIMDGDSVTLSDPYIVNGCQTTRSIWEVCQQRLDAGGTGSNATLTDWRDRAGRGVVVTKIVKVGAGGEGMLQEITRFTNSQNAVRDKDFLALSGDLRSWAGEMADRYDIYLEIQRGGWDSQKAWQRQHPSSRKYSDWANAFDLLKVYGAGWLGEAGTAFGKNPPFLPGGSIFKRITESADVSGGFGVEDLYAAHRLERAATDLKFGRAAEKPSRRQSRFLFYMVFIDLLRGALLSGGKPHLPKNLTEAMVRLFRPENSSALGELLHSSIEVIDEYLTEGTEDSVFSEPAFRNDYNGDLNSFLKSEQLGKTEEFTPQFRSLLAGTKRIMGRAKAGETSARDQILAATSGAEVFT